MQSACVDVWLADLGAAATTLDALDARLTLCPAEERARAAGMAEPIRALRWSRARIALRLLLATHVGLARARVPFAVSPHGKPSLASADLQFSLSHSGTLLLVALSPGGPVGVDVETRTTVDMDDRRRAAIEAAATALVPHAALPSQGSVRRLLQAWTRLEAVAKASGAGIGHVLTELAIQGPAADLADRPMPPAETMLVADGQALRVEDLVLEVAGTAAIALPREAELIVRTFPASAHGIDALEALARGRG